MTEGWRELRLMRLAIDPDVRGVLRVTSSAPLTIGSIAGRLGMGESRAYRLIQKMSRHGMLRKISTNGSRGALYGPNVRAIDLSLGHDGLGIVVEYLDGRKVAKRMTQRQCTN
ncbi:MAG: helix-turn-helix domain-containing protein [Methanomassiliicoccales archaeon]|nr:helix-turn-helix domain-containing protein [Methanomassiliicoccales archaeon]